MCAVLRSGRTVCVFFFCGGGVPRGVSFRLRETVFRERDIAFQSEVVYRGRFEKEITTREKGRKRKLV